MDEKELKPRKQIKKHMKDTVNRIMKIEDEINKIHGTMSELELLLKKMKTDKRNKRDEKVGF